MLADGQKGQLESQIDAGWRNSVSHLVHTQEVGGSNPSPAIGTRLDYANWFYHITHKVQPVPTWCEGKKLMRKIRVTQAQGRFHVCPQLTKERYFEVPQFSNPNTHDAFDDDGTVRERTTPI